MAKIYSIEGYWEDDHTDEFSGYLVTETDEVPEGHDDDEFFFHGISEKNLQHAVATKEPVNCEFVVTSYTIVGEY